MHASAQVSRKEMQATLALRFGGEGILKMKGIPFKAAAADVRKFFSNYKIKPDGISFIMHADGRPTGMAFIEFETPQEAVRAMEKDRAKFGPEYGDRFCMLQLVGRHEMDKVALQKESDVAAAPKNILVSGCRAGKGGWGGGRWGGKMEAGCGQGQARQTQLVHVLCEGRWCCVAAFAVDGLRLRSARLLSSRGTVWLGRRQTYAPHRHLS